SSSSETCTSSVTTETSSTTASATTTRSASGGRNRWPTARIEERLLRYLVQCPLSVPRRRSGGSSFPLLLLRERDNGNAVHSKYPSATSSAAETATIAVS
ncbi:hypothetical protein PENTCL1PPCAC_245, partial [Pristionchus entomophagus]